MKATKQGVFLRGIQADAGEAVIDIIGVIGWEVAFEALKGIFASLSDSVKRVVFDIYSPGGDVWDGNGIIQAIGELGKTRETEARVQVAASMATLIAVACQKRSIAQNGRFLVHNAWTVTQGDADAHEKRAKELRDCEIEAANFYAARTGKTVEEMIDLMDEERWLTPQETIDYGFVQAIDDPFDPDSFAGVRAELEADGKWPQALVELPEDEPTTEGGAQDDGSTAGTESNEGEAAEGDAEPTVPEGQAEGEEAIAGGIETPADEQPADVTVVVGDGPEAADETLLARALAGEALVLDLLAQLDAAGAKLDASIAEARKLQGERDQARATVEKTATALTDANAQIKRLLSGGLSFAPQVETWAQAMTACKGDYDQARKQFPDVYRAQREQDKANRK